MTKIDIEKIKILFLSHLYFPENENNNKEKIYNIDNYKEIEIIELIQQNTDFNKKAHFIIERNEFKSNDANAASAENTDFSTGPSKVCPFYDSSKE